MMHVAVIGLGRFGSAVARELKRLNHYVVAIDFEEKLVNSIVDQVSHALILDATNKAALLDAGIDSFDVAVVAIGDNTHAAILTTLLLKEIGVKKIYAKAVDDYHAKILQKVGADRVFKPEEEMGLRCARSISAPDLLDFISLGPGYSIAEVVAGNRLSGKTLIELNLREKANVNVLAIKHNDIINPVPKGSDRIEMEDVLIVAGADEQIEKLRNF